MRKHWQNGELQNDQRLNESDPIIYQNKELHHENTANNSNKQPHNNATLCGLCLTFRLAHQLLERALHCRSQLAVIRQTGPVLRDYTRNTETQRDSHIVRQIQADRQSTHSHSTWKRRHAQLHDMPSSGQAKSIQHELLHRPSDKWCQ